MRKFSLSNVLQRYDNFKLLNEMNLHTQLLIIQITSYMIDYENNHILIRQISC